MKKGLFGLIFVLCFAMPAYSEDLSKYSDKDFELLKTKLTDGARDHCIARFQQNEKYAKVIKKAKAACSCVAGELRTKLTKTDWEKLLPIVLTHDSKKFGAAIDELLPGAVAICTKLSGL